MRPHEKLDVWKLAIEIVVRVYDCTKSFPFEERYCLTSQIRRAAVSIPANIAEGAARAHTREFLNFLSISQGSSSELETELLIAKRLGYLSPETFDGLRKDVSRVAVMLAGLSSHIKKKQASK